MKVLNLRIAEDLEAKRGDVRVTPPRRKIVNIQCDRYARSRCEVALSVTAIRRFLRMDPDVTHLIPTLTILIVCVCEREGSANIDIIRSPSFGERSSFLRTESDGTARKGTMV